MSKANIEHLYKRELYGSAEILCNLYVSKLLESSYVKKSTIAEAKELYGDILVQNKKMKLALDCYKYASRHYSSKSAQQTSTAIVNLKFKEANCAMECREPTVALNLMESIVVALRTGPMHLLCAKLYKSGGIKNKAIDSYLAALSTTPLAVEIIEELVALGVAAATIVSVLETHMHSQPHSSSAQADGDYEDPLYLSPETLSWVKTLIASLVNKQQQRDTAAIQGFQDLQLIFPRNTYLCRLICECCFPASCLAQYTNYPVMYSSTGVVDDQYMRYQESRDAQQCFQQQKTLGRLSQHEVKNMDRYAFMLYSCQPRTKLLTSFALEMMTDSVTTAGNHLGEQLSQAQMQKTKPVECWLVSALCASALGEHDKAMILLDKAIHTSPLHAFCYEVKGVFLLSKSVFDQSIIAFWQAHTLGKSVTAYAGLISAYLASHKLKDAMHTAKEAVQAFPHSAHLYVLMGKVLINCKQLTAAPKAFVKALHCDPGISEASCLLIDYYQEHDHWHDALNCARSALLHHRTCPILQTKLGKILGHLGEYPEAMECLHLAMSLALVDPLAQGDAAEESGREYGAFGQTGGVGLEAGGPNHVWLEASQELDRLEGLMAVYEIEDN